ncbi:MAG: PxKF domain-containing protein, partial [Candidatus Limnocylindrales bacterium]
WGYLDHALGSASLVTQVTGVGDYHIDADEPSVLDYNTDFKSAGQLVSLYAPDQYRVSDHDPVIVGLEPVNAPPTADAGGPYTVVEGASVTLAATGVDPEGTAVTFEWDLDNNGSYETPGQSVTFSAPADSAPATLTVAVKVTDAFGTFATDTATVHVIWSFTGFFSPVDNSPALNSMKAGAAVPVKFGLGGDQGSAIFAAGYPTSHRIACDTSIPLGAVEETSTAGSSSLGYDALTGRYRYTWKTDRAWAGTCRQLVLQLADGTEHIALFRFTK